MSDTAATPAAPPVAPISAVPRRMRLVCVALAVVIVVAMVVTALALPSAEGVLTYRTSDQFGVAALGLLLGAGVVWLGRSRVDADASGVRFRNVAMTHQLPWQAVRAVRFDRKSAWASLLLENGDEVSLLAVQAVDGEYAARAVEALRRLHAAARAKDPKPPPLLY